MALASAKLSCRLIQSSHPSSGDGCRTPSGSPATFHPVQTEPGEYAEAGEQPQRHLIAAGTLLDCAHAGRQCEATDATGHADQTGHHTDLPTKTLWDQLEYGTVTCT